MPDSKGKRVSFDIETWQALDMLARDRMMTFQELADEAFADVLKKHGRPMDTRDAFRRSARATQSNDNAPSGKPQTDGVEKTASKKSKTKTRQKTKPAKSKRPAGGRRARS